MTTTATLEYVPIELARPSISEELGKLKLLKPSKHQAAFIEALQSPDVSPEDLLSLLQDPGTAQLPAEMQGVAWAIYGNTLYDAGRYAEALEAYERAIQLWPDYPAAHCNRGVALGQLGRYQEALETFERTTQLYPDLPDAHYNRGVVLGQVGRYQEALEAYEQAIQLRSDYTEALFNGGMALGRMGRHQEALKAFEPVYHLRRSSSYVEERIYSPTSYISLLFGLSALKRRSLPDYEKATDAFIKWRARARRDKQVAAFNQAVKEFKEALPAEDKDTFEDFMLGVRLASIRDPFRRWEAIGKEISKDWPEGVSAVDAIREQRE